MAKYFSVTVDELLSPSEVLTIAENNQRKTERHFRDTVLGLTDICMLLLLFLPLFAIKTENTITEASLLSLYGIKTYLKVIYYISTIATAITGILSLSLQSFTVPFWAKAKTVISIALGIGSVLIFIISGQPYAAVFAFSLLIIKGVVLIKHP